MLNVSNSRLNAFQKSNRKAMKDGILENGGIIHSSVDTGVTLVILSDFPGSRMGRMAVSVQSPDEQKFRRKVGEFYALQRFEFGEHIPVPMDDALCDEWRECMCEHLSAWSCK